MRMSIGVSMSINISVLVSFAKFSILFLPLTKRCYTTHAYLYERSTAILQLTTEPIRIRAYIAHCSIRF